MRRLLQVDISVVLVLAVSPRLARGFSRGYLTSTSSMGCSGQARCRLHQVVLEQLSWHQCACACLALTLQRTLPGLRAESPPGFLQRCLYNLPSDLQGTAGALPSSLPGFNFQPAYCGLVQTGVKVSNDAAAALASGTGGRHPGCVLVAGTGTDLWPCSCSSLVGHTKPHDIIAALFVKGFHAHCASVLL